MPAIGVMLLSVVVSAPPPAIQPLSPRAPLLGTGGRGPVPFDPEPLALRLAEWMGVPLEDFLGPQRRSRVYYVPWQRKLCAFLDLALGDPKDYRAVLKEIREKRDFALTFATAQRRTITTLEEAVKNEMMRAAPNGDRIDSWKQTIETARRGETRNRGIHLGKIREEMAVEAVGNIIERAQAEVRRRRGEP